MKRMLCIILVVVLTFSVSAIAAESNEPMQVEHDPIDNSIVSINGLPYYESAEDAPLVDPNGVKTNLSEGIMPFATAIITPNAIYQSDQWCKSYENSAKNPVSYYYTAYDKDEVNVRSSGMASFTLKTSSYTTASLTGSTKFKFAEYVELSLSVTVGTQWGKEFTAVVNSPKINTKYLLESNCEVKQTDYIYYDSKLFGGFDVYTAASHDKNGTVYNYSTQAI